MNQSTFSPIKPRSWGINFFFGLAVAGWLLAIIAYIAALYRHDLFHGWLNSKWMSNALFAVFLYIVLYFLQSHYKDGRTFFKDILRLTPLPVVLLAGAGIVYALVLFFLHGNPGLPVESDGSYSITYGQRTLRISAAEYDYRVALKLQMQAAAWIAIYGLEAVILFPRKRTYAQPLAN